MNGGRVEESGAVTAAETAAAGERAVPVGMAADEFRRAGHALVDRLAEFLATLPERPVTASEPPRAVREALDAGRELPRTGSDAERLLRDAVALLVDHSLFNGHPQFYGYVTSPPAPLGILGEMLAAAVNANVGAWRLAPMASEIEAQAVRWVAELIGYRRPCGGLFLTGGNMANIVGLLAARATAPWDVRRLGVGWAGARPLRVYASVETHTWIQKAADISGLGTDAIRWIPVDRDQRMDVSQLREAIESDRRDGRIPLAVVGSAGTVSTGAVDPLREMAAVCRETGAWFHVDGAYGGLAAAVPGSPADLQALALADSVAVDPHKWLYAPLEAGCVLVRDEASLRNAFAYHPPYYHFGDEAINYVDMGPQNSRGFRALKVWLTLQQAGADGYRQMIGDDIRLSKRLFAAVAAHPELEACTQGLSVTTFRFVPADIGRETAPGDAPGAYLNRLNEALLERIQRSGELFVSNAVVDGRYLLRACIVNFHTRAADIDAVPGIVVRLGREVDAELREGGL